MNNTNNLIELKEKIEKLSLYHQQKVFEIFLQQDIKYSENNNGIFIIPLVIIGNNKYKNVNAYICIP